MSLGIHDSVFEDFTYLSWFIFYNKIELISIVVIIIS
jgi:hypothetical protein